MSSPHVSDDALVVDSAPYRHPAARRTRWTCPRCASDASDLSTAWLVRLREVRSPAHHEYAQVVCDDCMAELAARGGRARARRAR
ncbi:MAG TPA: hypothetical protein VHF25_13130 [Nitriliruptorales bacterium]|nr:hypothetical protein [Nitriliruptorales bacterium]